MGLLVIIEQASSFLTEYSTGMTLRLSMVLRHALRGADKFTGLFHGFSKFLVGHVPVYPDASQTKRALIRYVALSR